MDGSLRNIVTGEMELLAVALAGGDPLTPFVVGVEGGGDEEDGDGGEEDLHGREQGTGIRDQRSEIRDQRSVYSELRMDFSYRLGVCGFPGPKSGVWGIQFATS